MHMSIHTHIHIYIHTYTYTYTYTHQPAASRLQRLHTGHVYCSFFLFFLFFYLQLASFNASHTGYMYSLPPPSACVALRFAGNL